MKVLKLLILTIILPGCNEKMPIKTVGPVDYKVQFYYLVPSDIQYSQKVDLSILAAANEMQKWFQVATGGLTFEYYNTDEKVK